MISETKIQAGARGIRASQVKWARYYGTIITPWDDLDPDRKTQLYYDARACQRPQKRCHDKRDRLV